MWTIRIRKKKEALRSFSSVEEFTWDAERGIVELFFASGEIHVIRDIDELIMGAGWAGLPWR